MFHISKFKCVFAFRSLHRAICNRIYLGAHSSNTFELRDQASAMRFTLIYLIFYGSMEIRTSWKTFTLNRSWHGIVSAWFQSKYRLCDLRRLTLASPNSQATLQHFYNYWKCFLAIWTPKTSFPKLFFDSQKYIHEIDVSLCFITLY